MRPQSYKDATLRPAVGWTQAYRETQGWTQDTGTQGQENRDRNTGRHRDGHRPTGRDFAKIFQQNKKFLKYIKWSLKYRHPKFVTQGTHLFA